MECGSRDQTEFIGSGETTRTATPEGNNKSHHEPAQRVCGPQPIPTLKCELMTLDPDSPTGYRFVQCIPNAREPTKFETDFFKGHAMLLVRTDPLDEVMKPFFIHPKKVRTFEVQVQGKFKSLPSGEIFVGAESLHKLELGMITRSISKASMAFAGNMVKDLQYSFGDDPDVNKDYQMPHVTSPMFPTFDKILITRPGEPMPPMGIPFDEDLDYRKERLKFIKTKMANIDMDTTFSFSVNTSNIDLENWKLCGIPMVRPIDLRVILGDSPIQLVAYQIPAKTIEQFGSQVHPQQFLDYVFKLRMTSVDGLPEMEEPLMSDAEDSDVEDKSPRRDTRGVQQLVLQTDDNDNEEEEEIDDDDQMLQPGEGESSPQPVRKRLFPNVFRKRRGEPSPRGVEERESTISVHGSGSFIAGLGDKAQGVPGVAQMSGWIKKRMTTSKPGTKDLVDEGADTKEGAAEIMEETDGDYLPTDYDMESRGDLLLCPGCVELNEIKRDQITILKRKVLYILMFNGIAELHHRNNAVIGQAVPSVHDDVPRIRSYAEISRALQGGLSPIPKHHKNKRLSTNEKRRRQVVESLKNVLSQNNPTIVAKLYNLLSPLSDVDTSFLTADASSSLDGGPPSKPKRKKEDAYEGKVALAVSSRHFTEQYLVLTKTEAVFYKGVYSKMAVQRLPITSVISVSAVPTAEAPIPEFSFFKVETHARVYYLALRCDLERNDWVKAFSVQVNNIKSTANKINAGLFSSLDPLSNLTSSIPLESLSNWSFYLARPASWRSDSKRVFNYRRIIFTPDSIQDQWKKLTPNDLIEVILSKAFELASHSEQGGGMATASIATQSSFTSHLSLEEYHTELWLGFLDDISLLQTTNLSALNERERVAFFLNLYHVMVLHGCLVIGPPPSWKNWNSFFNNIAYIVSYEVMSIAEVEHNILKAQMSRPSSLQFIQIPQSKFPGLAISHRDFRFNFCINCGAKSMPAMVPIYYPATLDDQLDEMTHLMLSQVVEIDNAKKSVLLPKFFLRDFSPATSGTLNKHTAALGYLLKVAHYIKKEDKLLLNRLMSEYSNITIKYKKPNFRCRIFSRFKSTSVSQDVSRHDSFDDSFVQSHFSTSLDASSFDTALKDASASHSTAAQVASITLTLPTVAASGQQSFSSTASAPSQHVSPREELLDSVGQGIRPPLPPLGSLTESSMDSTNDYTPL